VLLAAVQLAAARGFHQHAWQLAWNVTNVAYRLGRWHEGVAAVETGLNSAVRIGDGKAQFLLHRNIARCRFSLGDRERSFEHLDRALELAGDDQELLAGLHRSYGRMYGQMRRYSDALDHGRKALRIYQEIGHVGEALLLNAVGWYHAQLGNCEEALVHCRQSLERYEQLGDRISRAHPLDSIGFAYLRMGDPKQALPFLLEAAQSFRDADDRPNEADTLVTLGETYVELERPDEAEAAWRRAFDLVADVDPPIAECIAEKLRKLGEH
jgi:tetratricopeptide (TPR) repeat protein